MRIVRYKSAVFRYIICSVSILVCPAMTAQSAHAGTSIEAAVANALTQDPYARSLLLEAEAQDELAFAAQQLPDPTLRMGMMNFPVEDPSFLAEPMTQAVVGIRQQIPAVGSRNATSQRHANLAAALREQAAFQLKITTLHARNAWFDAHFYGNELRLRLHAEALIANLTEIIRARYSVGEELQTAVLAAELELSRIRSGLVDTQARQFEGNVELRRLTGGKTVPTGNEQLPKWKSLPPFETLRDSLGFHPRTKAIDASINAANANVLLRESEFKPSWTIDLSYGLRDGKALSGDARSDLASATMSLSLPLFAKHKQSRRRAAAQASEHALLESRIEVLRDMNAELEIAYFKWEALSQQLELLRGSIVVQSRSHAQAALQAYQNKAGGFAEVLRSYLDQINADVEQHLINVERLKVWAEIDSLNGATR